LSGYSGRSLVKGCPVYLFKDARNRATFYLLTSVPFLNSGRIERTIPFIFGVETADVGMDRGTPVTPDYEKGNNKFTGKIRKVTVDLK
jgi:hypothetical protein